jgi:hypothetical protein
MTDNEEQKLIHEKTKELACLLIQTLSEYEDKCNKDGTDKLIFIFAQLNAITNVFGLSFANLKIASSKAFALALKQFLDGFMPMIENYCQQLNKDKEVTDGSLH